MARANGKHMIFYDGGCGFCHRAVRAIALADKRGIFEFAPRNGETYHHRMRGRKLPPRVDSMIVLTPAGKIFVRADTMLFICEKLGGWRRAIARLAQILPHFMLDFGYRLIAIVRHRIFPTPEGSCPVMPSHLRGRFHP
ncbi:MAG TPA: DUF393 domain-containing protein [Candidatus Sumerlaeota bacterium]|nr:DUF393 domain-containing protein [Candidatus Sumerlaeota bacterium]